MKSEAPKSERFQVLCSWCGVSIRVDTTRNSERMCLICYARMLNQYFQKVRDRRREEETGLRHKA
jgi:hypothetical protein